METLKSPAAHPPGPLENAARPIGAWLRDLHLKHWAITASALDVRLANAVINRRWILWLGCIEGERYVELERCPEVEELLNVIYGGRRDSRITIRGQARDHPIHRRHSHSRTLRKCSAVNR